MVKTDSNIMRFCNGINSATNTASMRVNCNGTVMNEPKTESSEVFLVKLKSVLCAL